MSGQRADNAAADDRAVLQLLFDHSPVAKIVTDPKLRVTAWNHCAEKLFGYSRAEALGKHVSFLVSESARDELRALSREVAAGATREASLASIDRDGRPIVCEWHCAPLISADGAPLGISSVVLDVTERNRLKDALARSQKMDALGKLAGGIAHDFNNILAVIISYSSFVREDIDNDELRADIDEVLEAADRAAGLTRQLLAYSRQRPSATVEPPQSREAASRKAPQRSERPGRGQTVLVVEDDPALRKVTARVLESAGYSVHTATDGVDGKRRVDELGADLDVVVTDVAMPGQNGYDVAEHVRQVAPEAAVVLTSGCVDGTARTELQAKMPVLWKPAPPNQMVRAVAGAVEARSARGGPKRRALTRPLAAPNVRVGVDARGPLRVERVLLVEDDRELARASERALVGAGFEVVVAATLEASRAELGGGEFDALILDIGLPDGSGLELLPELRDRGSSVPVVMMTGALSTEAVAQALRSRVSDYLAKPFTRSELVDVVRATVDQGRISRLRDKLLASRCGGDELIRDLSMTEARFERALPKIWMAYQPIVRAVDSSVYGFEALLRCDEPSLASPVRLLAAAEVLGRVGELGRIIRESVAATLLEHRDRTETLFVNLHPSELRADTLAMAADPLRQLAGRVVLEVTERASLDGGNKLDEELALIRELGYRLAVDDLGEGYAGLSSLIRLTPDIAKLDMSLVRDIDKAPLKRDIVGALVDMARRAGIVVVAEGVETIEERDTLVDLGCDLLQGYLFARPGAPFPELSL